MLSVLFWIFALLMLGGAMAVICFRNPVSCALSMVASFVGIAGLFIGLDAYFIGVIQILVYAGAIMVLFLFIIMLLNLRDEVKRKFRAGPIVAGALLVFAFVLQLAGVLSNFDNKPAAKLDLAAALSKSTYGEGTKIAEALAQPNGKLPDVHIIGHTLFTEYNLPLQILGVLLLVATVGAVVLSKRQSV